MREKNAKKNFPLFLLFICSRLLLYVNNNFYKWMLVKSKAKKPTVRFFMVDIHYYII